MPPQDVLKSLVGEPDLVSTLVGETTHAGVHHQIPYRKVYRAAVSNSNTWYLDSTAFLLPTAGLSLGPGLLLSHVGADGDLRPDAHPLADHPPLLRGARGRWPFRRVFRYVPFVVSISVFHFSWSQRRLVRPLASRYRSVDAPPGADGRGERRAASMPDQAPPLRLRGGLASQSLKKVIWNPSPKRISSPPGILLANRTREW